MNREKLEKWVVDLYMLLRRDLFPKKDWAMERRDYAIRVMRWNEETLVGVIDFIIKCLEAR